MSDILRANAVSFRYPQNQRGVGPLSLSVRSGESVWVRGLSGCGKSTLARCLTGMIPHLYRGDFGGEVWLDGARTDLTPPWELAERAGFVFQNPALQMIAATVEEEILFGLENLGLARAEMRTRLEEALAAFGLEPFRRRSPQSLSGGEQQKLALAAVLARRPPFLVLDEPLSMLDTTSALEFSASLACQAAAGTAMVIFEHREAYMRAVPGLRAESLGGAAQPQAEPAPWESPVPHPPQNLAVEGLQVELGSKRVLDRLSFQLHGGQVTALVGPNGAGKTTLLRTLAGFQTYRGRIFWTDAPGPPRLGIVFQNPDVQLFNASVREEILYRVERPDLNWYRWLLAMLDLERYEDTPPLLLSEGEKRRAALATVLMRRPRSGILLDEPALGLDSLHQAILLRLLRALAAQGWLVLFSTHDLDLAAQADRLILLGAGGIAAQGPAAEVLACRPAWAQIGLARPPWLELPQ